MRLGYSKRRDILAEGSILEIRDRHLGSSTSPLTRVFFQFSVQPVSSCFSLSPLLLLVNSLFNLILVRLLASSTGRLASYEVRAILSTNLGRYGWSPVYYWALLYTLNPALSSHAVISCSRFQRPIAFDSCIFLYACVCLFV